MARSIAASPQGIQRIKAALPCSQEKFSKEVEISPATLKKFFRGELIDREIFCRICDRVKIDWSEVVQSSYVPDKVEESIDTLVQSTRSRLHHDVKKRCGWMKVLNMTYPIESSAIYTDVNLLGKPLHLRSFRELERSLPEFAAENFDRFWLGQAIRDQRRDGIETVQDTNLLMILGAPGAGKSTFLKRLAMLCYGEDAAHFQALVPFFVTLKEFAEAEGQPNLLNYLASLGNAAVDAETIATLLGNNRGLVLLDGLDEVLERDRDRTIDQIRAFADTYDRNHIVITCRIAARESQYRTKACKG
jgi:predicted NACHT family NTPase